MNFRSQTAADSVGIDYSRIQASGERRRVLHRRPRICMHKSLSRLRLHVARLYPSRAHVRANTEKIRDCHLVARTCDNEVGVAISIRDPYTSPFTSRCK